MCLLVGILTAEVPLGAPSMRRRQPPGQRDPLGAFYVDSPNVGALYLSTLHIPHGALGRKLFLPPLHSSVDVLDAGDPSAHI